MAMGRTFQESFQKAPRGLEVGVDGLNEKTQTAKCWKELASPAPSASGTWRCLRHGLERWMRCLS